MDDKKVLQLRSSLGYFGAENMIVELSKSLATMKYNPIIGVLNNTYCPHIEMADVAEKHGLNTKIFDCNSPFSLKTILEIRKYIKNNKINVIHSHGYKTNFFALLANLFEGKHLVCTCHPWTETGYSLKAKIYSWLDKLILNKFHKIVAVSSNVEEEIAKIGIAQEKVSLIENGIDIHRFSNSFDRTQLCQKYQIRSNRTIIGTIGRLVPEKAHDILFEAAKLIIENFPDVHFVIVGDGPLRENLENKVNALKLSEHVLFTGVSNNIPEVLSLMDIFVLSSISEGLPMVLLEAMAAKKPIVTTKVGEISNIISDKEDGVIVPPNDKVGLKKGIEYLLSNKEKAALFTEKAYSKVVEYFSANVMAKKYIRVYEQL